MEGSKEIPTTKSAIEAECRECVLPVDDALCSTCRRVKIRGICVTCQIKQRPFLEPNKLPPFTPVTRMMQGMFRRNKNN